MAKYLYAAAVQGIQSFIFQTNVLKDIVGASELVDSVCTEAFKQLPGISWKEENQVIAAAGNVKYVFDTREDCEKAVREFPRTVMTMAPGITISQAVVELTDDFEKDVNSVEEKLRAQRNRILPPLADGLLGVRRAPGTGLPASGSRNGKGSGAFIDDSTKRKQGMNDTVSLCVKSFYGKDRYRKGDKEYRELYGRVPFDVSGICGKNDWIAVIHADGNSLGQVVRHVGHDRDKFSEFSRELDKATILSANEAFEHLCRTRHIDEGGGLIPIRPIVLGGDDMTVIIRGDLAIGYVTEYMRKFQENTGNGAIGKIIREATEKDEPAKRMTRLTACAGVAFIKSSFPFYYGYRLAESLCDAAKKRAKEIDKVNVPACLMFHKVQDSFIESYADITERELTPQEGLSLQYGPYYLDEGKAPLGFGTVGSLLESVSKLRDGGDDIRPAVRRWLTVLHESRAKADQFLSRAKAVHPGQKALIGKLTEFIKRKDSEACPAYDVLALNTIMSQVTREESHED